MLRTLQETKDYYNSWYNISITCPYHPASTEEKPIRLLPDSLIEMIYEEGYTKGCEEEAERQRGERVD